MEASGGRDGAQGLGQRDTRLTTPTRRRDGRRRRQFDEQGRWWAEQPTKGAYRMREYAGISTRVKNQRWPDLGKKEVAAVMERSGG